MRVLPFSGLPTAEIEIPTPPSYQKGHKYFSITVPDDSLHWLGAKPGAKFIFLRGGFYDGHVHAAEVDGELLIGVADLVGPNRVRFISWLGGTHHIRRKYVIGSLEVGYPSGIPGDCYIWRPPESAACKPEELGTFLNFAIS